MEEVLEFVAIYNSNAIAIILTSFGFLPFPSPHPSRPFLRSSVRRLAVSCPKSPATSYSMQADGGRLSVYKAAATCRRTRPCPVRFAIVFSLFRWCYELGVGELHT
jgi:hypothetical protein